MDKEDEKLRSIAKLALCVSAPEGEWHAAALMFFRICRKHKKDPFAVAEKPSAPIASPTPKPTPKPAPKPAHAPATPKAANKWGDWGDSSQEYDWRKWRAPERETPTVNFGKHNGRTIHWIVQNDLQYALWVVENHKTLPLDQLICFEDEICKRTGKAASARTYKFTRDSPEKDPFNV